MTCTACSRVNLPGGVRCSYCGTVLPPAPEFDLGGEAIVAAVAHDTKPSQRSWLGAGAIGALLFLLFKGKSLLGLLKLFPMLASMAVFTAAEATIFGWQLAAGFTASIFIHEMGHVVMNLRHGIPASAPMFIPFVGAVILVRHFPEDPTVEAECGAGGPAAGLAAAAACSWLHQVTAQPYWATLAMLGYGINLFNLLPIWFLDGARIASAMGPNNWRFVIAVLVVVALKTSWPALWVIAALLLVMSLGRPAFGRHNLAAPAVRNRVTVIYLFLVLALTGGATTTHDARRDLIESRTATQATATAPSPPRGSGDSVAQTDAAPQLLTRSQEALLQHVVLLVLGLTGLTLACGIAAGTAGGAGQPFGLAGLRFAGMLFVPLVFLLAVRALDPLGEVPSLADSKGLATAYVGGLLAGAAFLLFERNHPIRRRRARPRGEWELQVLQAGAVGMLLAAFWLERLVAAVLFLVAAAILYFQARRWQWLGLLGDHRARQGRDEDAVALYEAALQTGAPRDAVAHLLLRIAEALGRLGRGEALEVVAVRIAASSYGCGASGEVLALKASALLRQERYAEALAACEGLLCGAMSSPEHRAAMLIVRAILAEMALQRGWTEECRAQVGELIRTMPQVSDPTLGRLARAAYALRAMALAREGDASAAEADIRTIFRYGPSTQEIANIEAIRAECSLSAGDKELAVRRLQEAKRLAPGDARVLYLLGRELLRRGKPEGRELLEPLARNWPRDFWGRRAAAVLAGGEL